MSTNPDNSYQGLQPGVEGEEAPPPAFNPDAVNPSDYSSHIAAPTYGTIPTHDQPQQLPPSQPPQYIQPPVSQPPIAMRQPNIQYVNQYGQPIQNPAVFIVPQQQQPQQPLVAAVPYKPFNDYKNPTKQDRKRRFVAAVLGIVSCILLISAMGSHRLASGTIDGYDCDCNVLFVHTNDPNVVNAYVYYSDFCLNFDNDVEWENWDDTTSSDWCDTWRGALLWIFCVVCGCLMSCLATCWVQPLCTMHRCCCPITCPRVFYAFGLVLCVLGNVLWPISDKVCLPNDALGLQMGTSINFVWGTCVVIFVALFCAK